MNKPDPWANILDKGEAIIWQGRPDGGIMLGISSWAGFGFGMLFAGFALVWMILAASAGGFFWAFGLIHFSVGVGISLSSLYWPAYRRRRTWYSLSDRRAFIATDIPLQGRKLKSYPIKPTTVLNLIEGDLTTITFATEVRRTKNGTKSVDIGFERIPDGPEVYRLMRDIQKGPAQRD